MALVTAGVIDEFIKTHRGWSIGGKAVTRLFEFADFAEAMQFVNAVAIVSERAVHHPDIHISWNRVTVVLSTHSEGGITEKDLRLAAEIGALGGADPAR